MASPGFVGRSAELAALSAALEEGFHGRGRLIFLSGGPGSGKSRLAMEAAELAAQRGALTGWGRCRETDGAPAFWPWIQVLRAIQKDHGLLGEAHDSADPFRTYDAVARSLAELARTRPLFLVLDDLHRADVGSLRLLRFVAAELEAHPITLVGTYRDEEIAPSSPLAALVGDVVTGRAVRLLPLEGLGAEDVAALITATTGTAPDPRAVRAIHERTGGNPFFVTEVARLGVEGRIPDSVREAIRARIGLLPEPTRFVLSTSSVPSQSSGDLRPRLSLARSGGSDLQTQGSPHPARALQSENGEYVNSSGVYEATGDRHAWARRGLCFLSASAVYRGPLAGATVVVGAGGSPRSSRPATASSSGLSARPSAVLAVAGTGRARSTALSREEGVWIRHKMRAEATIIGIAGF